MNALARVSEPNYDRSVSKELKSSTRVVHVTRNIISVHIMRDLEHLLNYYLL